MIPTDLTARLRMLTEASFFSKEPQEVGEPRAARAVPEDLPEFQPGQRILATIREAKMDGLFNVLVGNRQMTLAIEGQKPQPGDVLNLTVTRNTGGTVVATPTPEATASGTASASLSQTGRLISFLLTGQPAPSATSLAANRPLLAAPPDAGHLLVPMLKQAVSESGMFYESHQQRWVAGETSTAALLREPQAQASTAARHDVVQGGNPTNPAPATNQMGQQASATNDTAVRDARQNAAQIPDNRSTTIPDRLLPVVHQQLDALATNHYIWQGMAWPGQAIEWEIEDPRNQTDPNGSGDAAEPDKEWRSTLRLTMPSLGTVEARLHLTPSGLSLRLAADPESAERLRRSGADLAQALSEAKIPLTAMAVELSSSKGDVNG